MRCSNICIRREHISEIKKSSLASCNAVLAVSTPLVMMLIVSGAEISFQTSINDSAVRSGLCLSWLFAALCSECRNNFLMRYRDSQQCLQKSPEFAKLTSKTWSSLLNAILNKKSMSTFMFPQVSVDAKHHHIHFEGMCIYNCNCILISQVIDAWSTFLSHYRPFSPLHHGSHKKTP